METLVEKKSIHILRLQFLQVIYYQASEQKLDRTNLSSPDSQLLNEIFSQSRLTSDEGLDHEISPDTEAKARK